MEKLVRKSGTPIPKTTTMRDQLTQWVYTSPSYDIQGFHVQYSMNKFTCKQTPLSLLTVIFWAYGVGLYSRP